MPKSKSKKKDPEADVPLPETPESPNTKRRREHCDDFDVKALRTANGISKDAFVMRGHLPQKMEIFQLEAEFAYFFRCMNLDQIYWEKP